jgi:TRAP transporter TAXI family solute receptor
MKRLWVAALAAVAMTGAAEAQQFFRIGTGGTAGTYYPVGGMIANAVSQPGKIIVTAQASNGSVANVTAISGGALESGFTQADVATWAQTGTGVYEGKPKVADLRLIANLYPERVPASRPSPTSRASAWRSMSRARARWSMRS